MSVDLQALDQMSREDLIGRARVLGVERPEVMTRMELKDEIVRRSETDVVQRQRARGWLGVARDLVAGVVESGLNLPDAAALIRGEARENEWKGPPPVATVTLAEIYAHQGHLDRALGILDEVIAKESDHEAARALRERLQQERGAGGGRRRKVIVEVETEPDAQLDSQREEVTQPQAAPPPSDTIEPVDSEVVTPPEAVFASDDEEEAVQTPQSPSDAPHFEQDEAVAQPAEVSGYGDAEPVGFVNFAEPILSGPNTLPQNSLGLEADYGPVPLAEAGAEPAELAAVVSEPAPLSEQEPEPTLNFERRVPLEPDVSSAIAIRDDGRIYLYWEVAGRELASLRNSFQDARLVVRFVAHRPSPEGARRSEQVISTQELVGGSWVSEAAAQDAIRAAVGVEVQDRFYPLAIATVLAFEGDSHTLSVLFRARFTTAQPEVEERALAHYRSHLAA
jgi:hypothetical protein